ncbi:MAG: hypothetical protein KIS92_11085 [Planctomycetota bacterium]|nr:hypothetical protein [Planctomycetota bacterium]
MPARIACAGMLFFGALAFAAEDAPAVPRIDCVELAAPQPWKQAKAVLWYDDFDGDEATQQQYHEYDARSKDNLRSPDVFLGAAGQSLRMYYAKGSQGAGGRKLTFGDCPFGPPLRKGEKFVELYWRIYVKHPAGWTGGGPDKMSRCTSFTSGNWTQAMIGHVWSAGEALTLDPASGVKDGRVVTTKYNDFPNLKWLGNKPVSPFLLQSDGEAGRWVCVEAHVKLNTPGQKDGVMELWIDGLLQCNRTGLDWRGAYTDKGINAVFLEAYWNKGSPAEQSRWFDDFVVSTQPIGPLVAPANPVLRKTPFAGPAGAKQAAWEVQIAERVDAAGDGAEQIFARLPDEWKHQKGEDAWVKPVWASGTLKDDAQRVTADAKHGTFTGALKGQTRFAAGKTYFCRCRQQDAQGHWSAWSPWHQPFQTAREP